MFLCPKTCNDDAVSGKNELQLFSFITSILLERGFYLSFSSGAGALWPWGGGGNECDVVRIHFVLMY